MLSAADVDPSIAPDSRHRECEIDLEQSALAQRCPAFIHGEPLAGREQMAAAASPAPSACCRPASLAAAIECVSGHAQSRNASLGRSPNAVRTEEQTAPPVTGSGTHPHALEGGQRQQRHPA
jgi:hypothetical protein